MADVADTRAHDGCWAPPLEGLRLLGDGTSAALLSREAEVLWWCAPALDDPPLCWRLLDPRGGAASFPGLRFADVEEAPAAATSKTVLRDDRGLLQVRDSLLPRQDGVLLVRLLRRLGGASGRVRHAFAAGGFDSPRVRMSVAGRLARGLTGSRETGPVAVLADGHEVLDGLLLSSIEVTDQADALVVVAVGTAAVGELERPPEDLRRALVDEVERRDEAERARLHRCRLPRRHPQRALDAIAVLRSCTYAPTGAVVASPVTSLPEAPGADRQFDYRYSWLRDASLSTAVAALLGQAEDARRYLDFVHRAWAGRDIASTPVLTVRGEPVPDERDLPGIAGWAGSRPVRVGNGARDQQQHDAVGLLLEGVSVHLQAGASLDHRTWNLVRRLADEVAQAVLTGSAAGEHPPPSNGIWELRRAEPLVDSDIGRWLVLDRAVWIARGWRPWARRQRWLRARAEVRRRVLAAVQDDGLLPQAYGQHPPRPDASALMAVAFGLVPRNDARASGVVDAVLARLGSGPHVYRYPPDGSDGFAGREGAFLPMSFLAVTALARLGRIEEATARLDRLCASLPRLLPEEVDPLSGHPLGNTPLLWSHAELARALYVLDAATRRERWGTAVLWAWRLQRYLRMRHSVHRAQRSVPAREERAPRSPTGT